MKVPPFTLLTVCAWIAATFSGVWAILSAANTPGAAGAAAECWPAASHLSRPIRRPSLVVFVHPQCPCSRASLGELAELMARCAGQLEARVNFVDPVGRDVAWAQTDLWQTAEAIPGVAVRYDAEGREARAFGSATSGDAFLYDADGRLLFHGGITLARGHAGDNPGRSAIEELILAGAARAKTTPVFGCELFGKLGLARNEN